MMLFKRLRKLEEEVKRLNDINNQRDCKELLDKFTKMIGKDVVINHYQGDYEGKNEITFVFPSIVNYKLLSVNIKPKNKLEFIVSKNNKDTTLTYDTTTTKICIELVEDKEQTTLKDNGNAVFTVD